MLRNREYVKPFWQLNFKSFRSRIGCWKWLFSYSYLCQIIFDVYISSVSKLAQVVRGRKLFISRKLQVIKKYSAESQTKSLYSYFFAITDWLGFFFNKVCFENQGGSENQKRRKSVLLCSGSEYPHFPITEQLIGSQC